LTATVEQVEALGGFPVIYADPAWRYTNKGVNGAAEKHYPTMSVDELCALPVRRIAAKNAVLFLWYTNPLLPEALRVVEAWGFRFKTIPFTWVKSRNFQEFFGLGQWTRGNPESVMLGVRGKPPRPIDRGVRHLVWGDDDETPVTETICAPVGRHSAKPPEVRTRIEQMLGPLDRIELFARERAPGWYAWGNEINSDVNLQEATP
jgi:N6-adenosine-specific RNA methylase IME4